jgi:hypothetical protein
VLLRICWIAWIAGMALIVLSWTGAVTPAVGWAGFAAAVVSSLVSYVLPRPRPEQGPDWAVLTRAMVEAKDHGYDVAMDHLRRGGVVFHDGMAFALRPGGEVALSVVASAPAAEMDEVLALRDAERARAGFEALERAAPELASAAADRKMRVSLLSEYGASGFEICRVAEDQVEWKVKSKGTERLG